MMALLRVQPPGLLVLFHVFTFILLLLFTAPRLQIHENCSQRKKILVTGEDTKQIATIFLSFAEHSHYFRKHRFF